MTRLRPRPARSAAIRVAAAGAALLAGAALAVVPVLPASAHNYPIGSAPADGATVTEQPGAVSLTTNDKLLDLGASYLEVVGPDGRYYATGCAEIDGPSVTAPAQLGPAGDYTVDWQVVSIDGHPISGSFAFTWAPAAGVPVAEGGASPVCADAGAADGDGADGGSAASAAPSDAADGGSGGARTTDVLWIGGGVLAALAAALVAGLVLRRRPRDED